MFNEIIEEFLGEQRIKFNHGDVVSINGSIQEALSNFQNRVSFRSPYQTKDSVLESEDSEHIFDLMNSAINKTKLEISFQQKRELWKLVIDDIESARRRPDFE